MTTPFAPAPDAADSTTDDRLAAFLTDTVGHFKGTVTAESPAIWQVTNPVKHPTLFGPDGQKVTTDKEASLLDPELALLAEGTPLLQTLVLRVREQGLTLYKGRYTRIWPQNAIEARLAQDLLPPGTPYTLHPEDQQCLRAVFRVRLSREFIQEDVLRLMVDGDGEAWSGAVTLEGQGDLLQPLPQLAWDWETLQERYQQALLAAEEALMPLILDHEAELAEQLKRENHRITTYYDEVEATGEYAESIDDLDMAQLALEALHTDRAKLLSEQQRRYRLTVQVMPVSLALIEARIVRAKVGDTSIVFHPLLIEPILPACDGCARRMPIARFDPGPLCPTCALQV
ncbi:MAG: hypothetical protein H7338_10350 [Candidatus Sericytochromatia bacterium]|nr:hypothetical protein [Candidatus Sericytochromatia bacterium]